MNSRVLYLKVFSKGGEAVGPSARCVAELAAVTTCQDIFCQEAFGKNNNREYSLSGKANATDCTLSNTAVPQN